MITLFVALYFLLCLCTTGNTSDIKEFHVKTVKPGEAVTMECNITAVKDKKSLAWYRQSFGKVPQFFVRQYVGSPGYLYVEGFNNSRFSVTVNGDKFDLNINEIREDDGGEYFCGYVEGSTVKFTSGTRLQFEGKQFYSDNLLIPDQHFGSNSGGYQIIALIASNIISVIVIVALVGVLFKQQRKGSSSSNHQTPTNQSAAAADDEDVLNYAAVSFAKKPSSSRTSRDTSHQDVYAQVKIK
ncbi:uncharacterized protein LOC128514928 [Clarias gariepinus]|uniref:uncharacterized protein LOC128514928 n=1 Tax=Clarias gariepinus TaxID=13013 RepID=UPI00234DB76C|nr:uncharacterized protein LOC128514928 [Clarias gariepinus]